MLWSGCANVKTKKQKQNTPNKTNKQKKRRKKEKKVAQVWGKKQRKVFSFKISKEH